MGQRFATSRRKRWTFLLLSGLVVAATSLAVRHYWGPSDAIAQAPKTAQARSADEPKPAPSGKTAARNSAIPTVVALVNNEEVTKAQLGKACVKQFGKEVLESMVNKYLITQECQKHQITVTPQDVNEEIERLAQRFGLPRDQWLKMLQEERDISPQQYARDIIWPTVALRKLAADRLQPTEEEILEVYETQFGPARHVRLIACDNALQAEKVQKLAMKNPEQFSKLAIEHSKDLNSASTGGLIQPIRLHVGDKNIERSAFSLAPGQISEVIPVGKQFIILKCEKHIERQPIKLETVREKLVDAIRDGKLRKEGHAVFRDLQKESNLKLVLNDPKLRKSFPGVAAFINDHRITIEEVTEECLLRHGKASLHGLIGRKLLEQACKEKNVIVTEDDIQQELAEAAVTFGMVDKQGQPLVEEFLKKITEEQDMSAEVYIEELTWPTAALKKLCQDKVQVTEDDLNRGFEANYGERVRCRAIVFANQRRAREVWEMARRTPTVENFAALAEQYSVDPASRALRGEIPPIARHSGRDLIEKEVFRLAVGELSSVIQVDDKWIIVLCEGRTTPVAVKFEDVKDGIYKDVFDKKLHVAMSTLFSDLQEKARIDNILAGTSQAPETSATAGTKPASGERTSSAGRTTGIKDPHVGPSSGVKSSAKLPATEPATRR